MFEDRGHKRTFYSAPQSVTSLVAAFLEPSITVVVFLAVSTLVRRADPALGPHAVPAGLRAHLPGPQPLPGPAAERRRRHHHLLAEPARDPGAVRLRHAQPGVSSTPTCCSGGPWSRPCCSGWPCFNGRKLLRRLASRPENRRTRGGGGRRRAGGEGGAGVPGARRHGPVLPGLLRRPRRRPRGRRRRAAAPGQPAAGGALHPRTWRARGLHHAAAGLAAAHRRTARAGAGHHGQRLLRARRVRHQHHPGPAAGHERRAGGGHVRDAVHRHQPARQAPVATSCWPR